MGWDTTSIVYITFEAITGFITIFGNMIVLVTIIRTHQLHTVTNVFIGNLAVADIFVGLFVAPLAALSFLGLPKNVYGCIFVNCAILMFTNVSILMLLGVAIERFIAIKLPFVYNRLLTIRRAMLLNGGIWILGSLLGLIPMYGWNIAPDNLTSCSFTGVISMEYMIYFQFFGLVVLPIAVMLGIYSYILCVIRKHAKRTDTLNKMFREHRRSGSQWKKEVRAAKFFALLIVLFAVFWLPVNIMNSITLFCPSCYQPYELLLAAIVMSHANSSINPVLYAASNSRIQKSIKALFSIKRGLNDSLAEINSRKYNSELQDGACLARHKSVSVIGVNGNEDFNNSVRLPPSTYLPKKCSDEDDNQNSPELRQLSPALLAASNDEGSGGYRLYDEMHVSEKSFDAHSAEITRMAKVSEVDGSQDSQLFSDIALADRRKHTKYGEEHVSESDPVTVLQQDINTSSTLPKSSLGHINFGYMDDKSNGSVSPLTSFPVREFCTKMLYEETKNYNGTTSDKKRCDTNNFSRDGDLTYSASDDRAEDQIIKTDTAERDNSLKTIALFPSAAGTEAVGNELRRMRSADTKPRLFEMEDEPSLERDYNTFTCVTSEICEVGKIISGRETTGQSSSNHGTNVHSYFRPRKDDINSSKISDVEINAQDIFTNAIQSQQMKL